MYIVELNKKELKQNLCRTLEFLTSESEDKKSSFLIVNTVYNTSVYIDSEARDDCNEVAGMDYCEFEKFAILKSDHDIITVKLTESKIGQILSFVNSCIDNDEVVVIITNDCFIIMDGNSELRLRRY
jgi:hypothetical protein